MTSRGRQLRCLIVVILVDVDLGTQNGFDLADQLHRSGMLASTTVITAKPEHM
ncbi:hypothetical protein [Mycolicibacterium sp. CH28]|uniref:hypothetical protein n=1 Tax=Mycolicibacterium sp. CH28 TaxID=2512237 RepID=UPI001386C01A|nr:hypothetical protein [Mycolicibacterium sp. CH28]